MNVIMLSVVMLGVVILGVVMLGVVMLGVVMLGVVMLGFAESVKDELSDTSRLSIGISVDLENAETDSRLSLGFPGLSHVYAYTNNSVETQRRFVERQGRT
jgi:hypothetical protein